jgi:hypothetical protein
MTSSAFSVLRLSNAAFHSLSDTERTRVGCSVDSVDVGLGLSDTERTEVGCSVDSVGGVLGAGSAGRAGGSACDAVGDW